MITDTYARLSLLLAMTWKSPLKKMITDTTYVLNAPFSFLWKSPLKKMITDTIRNEMFVVAAAVWKSPLKKMITDTLFLKSIFVFHNRGSHR